MKRVTITHTTPEGAWSKTWVDGAKATDIAAKFTDDRLRNLAGELRTVYQNAADDLYMKQASWIAAHEKRVEKYRAQVEAGILKQEDFDAWMQGQLFQEQQWALKRGQIARAMVDVDKQAMAMMNDGKLEVFAENANYMGFVIDRDTGAAGSFGLYDRQTVTRLIRDRPNLLPMPEIDEEKDYAWYNGIINKAVTQGILQGESLDRIVLRVVEETGDKSLVAMRRNARTAYTGAQNAGRVEGMRQARDELGIEIKKRWMATLDDKTRDAHGDLDGREADIDEPFDSLLGPIMFPGDPDADPANVYNCRCTLVTFYPKYQNRDIRRVDAMTGEDAGATTYKEWKKAHAGN